MSNLITAKKRSSSVMVLLLLASITLTANAALIRLPQDGHLILEAGGGGCMRDGLDPIVGIDVDGKQRHAFTMRSDTCEIKTGTGYFRGEKLPPAGTDRIDMGYFPAGTDVDFYHGIWWRGSIRYAYSRNLGTVRETPRDREVFSSRWGRGLGGTFSTYWFGRPRSEVPSIVESKGVNHWVLHMDDAGSANDDDNDLSVTVRLKPISFSSDDDTADAQLNEFFCSSESLGASSPVSFSSTSSLLDRVVYTSSATDKDFSGDLHANALTGKGKPSDKKWSAANMLDTKSTPTDRVMLTSRMATDECEVSPKRKHRSSMLARRGIPFRWKDLASTQKEDLSFGSDVDVVRFQNAWGKPGYGDGSFNGAGGIATDTDGNIYVADPHNHGIQKFDPTGRFIARWGKRGPRSKWGDRGTYGKFSYPQSVATDKDNNVYVTGAGLHRIQKFDSSGNLRATWGSYGKGDGQFHTPQGIATDSKGNVYVVDSRNNRVQKFDSSGNFITKWGHLGRGNKQFFDPGGIAVGPGDIIYVTDMRNHRVQKFTSSGGFVGEWGKKGSKENELFYPMGITTDRDGNVYVADKRNDRIQKFDANGVFLKSIGSSGLGDGHFDRPFGIAINQQTRCEKAHILVTSDNRVQRFSTAVDKVTEDKAKARLEYLRGDRTNEGRGYRFRPRSSILGDIVHSKAIHVGAPPVHPGTGHACTARSASKYPAFLGKHKKRTSVVYVGANDGALHGFRADNGQEVLAYLPDNLFNRESRKGYRYLTEPGYKHRYYVDGTPFVADAFIKGTAGARQWQTVLLGSEGAGGRGLFALNVTDPDAFSEANASKIVMWEFTNKDDSHLGYTFAQPTIALMPNCRWAAIVGNGYADTALDKTAGQSQLFIIYLDGGTDGVWTLGKDYIRIPTGVGSHSNRNGLSTPSVVDLNRDGVADRAYAGDLQGNLWVFDFTSPNPTDWIRNKKLLFAAGKKQPITVQPTLIRHPVLRTPTSPDIMVFFGTGQYFAKDDHRTTTKQSFYAVTDRGRENLTRRHLLRQRFLKHSLGSERRITDSSLTVDYGKHYGWYLDLPATGERVVSKAFAVKGLIHFNTLKPSGKGSCPKGSGGWMMSLKTENGGNPIEHGFRRIGDSLISSVGRVSAHRTTTDAEPIHHSGKKFDSAKGIPSGPVVVDGRRYTAGTKTKKADELVISNDPNRPKNRSGRLSWMQLFPRQS